MPTRVRVATYNLYLGADLSLVLGERDADELRWGMREVQRQLMTTAFSQRARAIAGVLVRERPDLVGLQEVTTWSADGRLVWDYAGDLLAALEHGGQPYEVAATVPTFRGSGAVGLGGRDVTLDLVGSNTILRRVGSPVRVTAAETGMFGQALEVRALGLDGQVDRGWCAVSCVVDGAPQHGFTFLNTHTEAYDPVCRDGQRDELLARVAAADRRVVLVGDFNATPDLVRMPAGFVDAWVASGGALDPGHGATCCQGPDLKNPTSQLTERIDYVFLRGVTAVSCRRIGADPEDRTRSGLWPSDHAAVVAEVELAQG
jgi:endonuclease/exonuclease/phosphatase family metal-dependent hydrolase